MDRNEVWNVISESILGKVGLHAQISQPEVTQRVCSRLNISENDFINTTLKREIAMYKEARKRDRKEGKRGIIQPKENIVVFDKDSPLEWCQQPEPPETKRRCSGHYKPFAELLSNRQYVLY